MLVLTRYVGQSVIINGNIDVKILGIRDNQVRVGIDAPKDITVHRDEIYRKILMNKNDINDDNIGNR